MHGTTNPDAATTRERLLWATSDVLARSGTRKLSLSDVAAATGVSRPTLYRWFPSKEALLEAFGVYEQEKYDAGIAQAISGLEGDARLDAILRFIVEFQHTYSLRRIVDVEPEHVVHQMTRIMPIMRDRLLPHFAGPDGRVIATVVTRIALSHALIPDDDPELFYAELRHAAGLESNHTNTTRHRHRPARPTPRRTSHEPETAPQTDPDLSGLELAVLAPVGPDQPCQTKSWSGEVIPGMDVYDLSSPVARTEVRAMYGGLQMAIGTAALVGATRDKHRDSALGFFVLALSGLSLCRLGGMVAEGETSYLSFSTKITPGKYNQVGLAMYELPNMIIACILFVVRPRRRDLISDRT